MRAIFQVQKVKWKRSNNVSKSGKDVSKINMLKPLVENLSRLVTVLATLITSAQVKLVRVVTCHRFMQK